MQFVQNGPDVPEPLLQAHEDGQVVFFCGAGISYPADLPGFGGLVDKIYEALGTRREPLENQAYELAQYDTVLDLLERRVPGQRKAVRSKLLDALKPNMRLKGAIDNHAALLQLALDGDGALRLVTTNFDHVFRRAMKKQKVEKQEYSAPMLPVPKRSRWDGIVYLHGLLPNGTDESALNRLVLTSGDFGLAYLTERWAARFVSELFRDYVVCFVGYSVSDPVMRYIMDALAADRLLGEDTQQTYAFVGCESGTTVEKTDEWGAKSITPILYDVPADTHDHSLLSRTLRSWSETYRDGVRGKERIVVENASSLPLASTVQDDFVGRMLWALSDGSGLPAKQFADTDPVPSFEWLSPLSDARFGHKDLPRFGIQPNPDPDDKLEFSLVQRPSPYPNAPWMRLLEYGDGAARLDPVMTHLCRWMVRHLNNPELLLWVTRQGNRLHDEFAWRIENHLSTICKLEAEGNAEELDRIRGNAPDAIPIPLMRTAWRLVLTGKVRSGTHELDLYRWKDRVNRDGLTTTLRLQLRELLAPRLRFRPRFRLEESEEPPRDPRLLSELVRWELVLAADYAGSTWAELKDLAAIQENSPVLLNEFQALLRDALDIFSEIGAADNLSDRSFWDLPSISPHWQNRGFRHWVTLIEMLRDCWLEIYRTDAARASQIARDWINIPYPTFRRLSLHAATYDGIAPRGEWIDWLLENDGHWLWSFETRREALRLLVLQGPKLAVRRRQQLERAILEGPPRQMFKEELSAEEFSDHAENMVWLRLAKLDAAGAQLAKKTRRRFNAICNRHRHWKLAENERDEFSHWMSGTGDPDYEDERQIETAPENRRGLVEWLQKPRPDEFFYEDNWQAFCRENFATSAAALWQLANEDKWPGDRWRQALAAWSEEKYLSLSWRWLAPLISRMPDEALDALGTSLSWWLEASSKNFQKHEDVFFNLCNWILGRTENGEWQKEKPVSSAINHPIGHVAQAIIHRWFKTAPNDDQRLSGIYLDYFTKFSQLSESRFQPARVILAANIIALFRVDREWTTQNLLPAFSWSDHPVEAQISWTAFLWTPRLYRPLLAEVKDDFLETANHYDELGEFGIGYASLLTYAAIDPLDTFLSAEMSEATKSLPQSGLENAAQALISSLEAAGDQRAEHWENRIKPYLTNMWPKDKELVSSDISTQFALLAIAAGGKFPDAVLMLEDWLIPLDHPGHALDSLEQSEHAVEFPKEALALLRAIIDERSWPSKELRASLTKISQSWPEAQNRADFKRLDEIARKIE